MKRISMVFFALLLIAAMVLPVSIASAAPAPSSMYFGETGHNLSSAFLNYWRGHGGLAIFGLPRTEEFQEGGYTVQYFERARFEYHPEFAGTPYEVLLGLLGKSLTEGRDFPQTGAFQSTKARWFFPETGHSLNYGFLSYWQSHGGLAQFGYPISEEFEEQNAGPPYGDGKVHTVQYFERARFEYHPELPEAYEVSLGLLGNTYIERIGVPQERLARAQPLASPPPAAPPTSSAGPSGLVYGMNAHLFQQNYDFVLGYVRDAGFGWVKQQVPWMAMEGSKGQIDWSEVDRFVDAVNNRGLRIILSITKAPSWATADGSNGLPRDPNDFASFMAAMASRYRGRVGAYELWNEQNTGGETGGNINVATYVNLLKAAYPRIKEADPNAIVVSGALTPTGVNDVHWAIDDAIYLDQMYQYNGGEVRRYFDALGAHAGGYNNPPGDTMQHRTYPNREFGNHPSFYFRRIEDLRNIMVKHGDGNKKMWVTEFGWSTANQAPGYEYGNDNSEADQAKYLVDAFNQVKSGYPWVGALFVWNLNYATVVPANDEKAPFGILYPDFAPRPAYNALKGMPK